MTIGVPLVTQKSKNPKSHNKTNNILMDIGALILLSCFIIFVFLVKIIDRM